MAAWRHAAVVLLAGGATVAAALATPVTVPESGLGDDAGAFLPEALSEPEPERLGAFLESRRWGVFAEEKVEEPPPDEPAVNPVLARLGFVGLIVTGDESAVLLRTPEGGIARVRPGQILPDGRVLVSVTDNHLTLKGEGGPEEVLTLFPPVRSAPPDGDGPPGGGEGARAEAALATPAPAPAPGAGASQ